MNRTKNSLRVGDVSFRPEPAVSVVVYRFPGPDEDAVEIHAQTIVRDRSACGTGGGLGYVTLFVSDFDRIWTGVEQGDALGTAYSVLDLLGPDTEQFINRPDDFIFGWIGE